MVRIDFLIFGYRKFEISPEDLSLATSLLLRNSIPSLITGNNTISVRERDIDKAEKIFTGKISYSVSKPLGLYGEFKSYKNKRGFFAGLALSLFLVVLSSGLVWDIRVEGNDTIPDSAVIYGLSECGFSVGDFWLTTDRSEVETQFLKENDNISWININRKGTVAYIKVIENNKGEEADEETKAGYSNIVANDDCIIEEITVKRGTAEVKIGDSVKKGEILISGILPEEAGGGLCYAEGQVIGRISEVVFAEVSKQSSETVEKSRECINIKLNIFNFSINIFKRYGNIDEKCDIIEDVDSFSLFGKCKLPFEIVKTYRTERKEVSKTFTNDELVRVASSRLDGLVIKRLVKCDLIKKKTYGEFTNNGYKMTSELVYLREVSENVKIDTEP